MRSIFDFMYRLPLPRFETRTAKPAFGMPITVGLLEDWQVRRFVERTRRRYGIEPPRRRIRA